MAVVSARVLGRRALVVLLLAVLLAAISPATGAQAATTYSISGTVTLPPGAPSAWLEGVSVRARLGTTSTMVEVDASTGNYTVRGLAPGSYEIAFFATGYRDATTKIIEPNLVDQYYGNSLTASGATKVTVGSANLTGINASLAIGKKITGTITLPSGVPMEALGAVEVYADGDTYDPYGRGVVDTATGEYEISGLVSDSYIVRFDVTSYYDPATSTYLLPNVADEYYDNSMTSAGATRVNVATDNVPNINVALATGRTLSGKVTLPAGAPSDWINAVQVYAINPPFYNYGEVDPVTGNFTIEGLAPGSYYLHFWVTSYYDASAGKSVTPNLASEYWSNSPTAAGSTKVTVASGNLTGYNAALDFTPLSTFTTAPTPTIPGTATVGSTLTASVGSWSPTPDSYTYQWFRDGVKLSGATASQYTVTASDAGRQISVMVTAAKFAYKSVSKASARVSVPVQVFTAAPTPTITGTVKVGNKVTVVLGSWSPRPDSMSYQWFRDGVKIPGAVSYQYALTTADAGRQVSVMATAKKAGYKSVGKASARVSVPWMTFTATPTPTITGTAKAGSKVTGNLGTWSPKPDSVSYQWYRDGVKISGAVYYTYTLTTADKGRQVSVMVTAKKAGHKSVSKASTRINIAN